MKVFNYTVLGAFSMLFLAISCGKKIQVDANEVDGKDSPSPRVNQIERASDFERKCSMNIRWQNQSSMERALRMYFYDPRFRPDYDDGLPWAVDDVQPPVTFCLNIRPGGNEGKFRIEYADAYGGTTYTLQARYNNTPYLGTVDAALYHAEINSSKVDIIFLDNQSFTQIVGTKISAEKYRATVQYVNLPTAAESFDYLMEAQAEKCRNGTYTAAQCMGYNFPPQKWWEIQYYGTDQRAYELAQEMLEGNGPNPVYQFGTIEFNLDQVENWSIDW